MVRPRSTSIIPRLSRHHKPRKTSQHATATCCEHEHQRTPRPHGARNRQPQMDAPGGDNTASGSGSRGNNFRGNAPSFRSGRGGRGRGGNRGRSGNKQSNSNRNAGQNASSDGPAPSADAVPANPTAQKLAAVARPLNNNPDEADVPDDAELCFICANVVAHHSIAPCNHTTCHICGLRMRALYKDQNCAHCRVRPIFLALPWRFC